MKVRRKNVLYFMLEVLLCMCVMYIIDISSVTKDQEAIEKIYGAFSLINVAVFFICLKWIRNELFSIASLFVIFLYLFNLGLPIARLFGWIDNLSGTYFMNRRIYSMGTNTFNEYLFYVFCLVSMLQVGILHYYSVVPFSCISTENDGNEFDFEYDMKLMRCHTLGTILILIGILPYIYSEFVYVRGAMIYGYQNAENTVSLSGTGLGLLGNMFIIGAMMWMISYQRDKKKFDSIFVALTLYQVVRMFITGDRSTGIALILVWLLIRHKFVSPIKGFRACIYLVGIYFSMVFIKLIEMTRAIGSPTVTEAIHDLFQSNILADTVFEYGGNVWCGMMVYYSVPETGSFRCGLTYLAAIIGKPLSVLNITNRFMEFADFSVFLGESERGALINKLTDAMGGSFSGEWWFNFGWIGIVLIVFFGYYLAKFSDVCVNSKRSPIVSTYLLYVATLVIWWVRQYFTAVSWYALFYGTVIFILNNLLSRRQIYNE